MAEAPHKPANWSYSKIKILETCPRLFKATYLTKNYSKGTQALIGESAVVGTFIHKMFELCVPDLQKTSEFNIEWNRLLAASRMTTAEQQQAETLKNSTRSMIRTLQTKYPNKSCLTPEVKLEDTTLESVAYIDLKADHRTNAGLPVSVYLYDYKTASPTKNALKRVTDQLTFYVGMFACIHPEVEELKGISGFVPAAEFMALVTCRTQRTREALVAEYQHRVLQARELLSTLKAVNHFPEPKKITPICKWCSVKSCPKNRSR